MPSLGPTNRKARVILHIDLDYFFAQVEEREDSSLKGKPVVVCVYSGRSAESGAVSTANYEARKLGVRSGIPISLAKRMLKGRDDAAFLKVNEELYEGVSTKIMALLRAFADRFEEAGIDEAFLEVTERVGGDFGRAQALASEIKEGLMAREKITCSIGIGPNKLLAKMASDFRKPDGLTSVRPGEEGPFLAPLPVGKLYGVGVKTEKKLNELGIRTVGDLAAYDAKKLMGIFGRNLGAYFHRGAHGIDDEPVQEREGAEQLSRIATLKQNTRDMDLIAQELERLSQDVHTRLLEQGQTLRSLGIIAIMEDLSIRTRSRTLEGPTDSLALLKSISRELFELLLREERDLSVRRVGVKAFNLVKRRGQRSLPEFLNA